MKASADEVPEIVDLILRPTTTREQAITLVSKLCNVAFAEGVMSGTRAYGELLDRTFGGALKHETWQ